MGCADAGLCYPPTTKRIDVELGTAPATAVHPGAGPADDGDRWLLNVQPVVPITLNEDWNLISRTIVPVVWQDDIFPGAGSQSGVGDIVQSVFFSPKAPTAGGVIWGVGPVFLLPTGSDDLLTTGKWGAGPTGVEMEALTAASVAALTIYDMCKAVDKAMIISDIRLLEKTGGKSGHYLVEAV